MEGKRFISEIEIKNLLSFDKEGINLELQPLNVLIGPNGSGKSNFLDAIGILSAAPFDITSPFRSSGGIAEWMFKGHSNLTAAIRVRIGAKPNVWDYELGFKVAGAQFDLENESLWVRTYKDDETMDWEVQQYSYRDKFLRLKAEETAEGVAESSALATLVRQSEILSLEEKVKKIGNQSIFSLVKSYKDNTAVYMTGLWFGSLRLYRNWGLGRNSKAAQPQSPDQPSAFLSEDGDNLAGVLDDLLKNTGLREKIIEYVKSLNPRVSDLRIGLNGGLVQVFVREKGLMREIPATRLSDGTVRLMCLLAILLHHTPPPLICLEEPELGFHPDLVQKVAELLKDAATRTQLIVTTHSDLLVSALSDVPESIVVCEHDGKGTRMKRLEREPLKKWLKEYSLGEVWLKGEIGGTRW